MVLNVSSALPQLPEAQSLSFLSTTGDNTHFIRSSWEAEACRWDWPRQVLGSGGHSHGCSLVLETGFFHTRR